jgi:hypothetical protein
VQSVSRASDHFSSEYRALSRQKTEQLQQQKGWDKLKQIAKRASITDRHGVNVARRLGGVKFAAPRIAFIYSFGS